MNVSILIVAARLLRIVDVRHIDEDQSRKARRVPRLRTYGFISSALERGNFWIEKLSLTNCNDVLAVLRNNHIMRPSHGQTGEHRHIGRNAEGPCGPR